MFFVYLLLSEKDQNFYIGFSENVEGRFNEHQEGKVESTKYRRPFNLIYYEAYEDMRDALGRKKFLKSGSGHRYINKQLRYFLENRGLVKPVEKSSKITGHEARVK